MVHTLPPGPRRPALIQTLQYFGAPPTFLARSHRRYGDRFTVRVVGMGTVVFLADPEDVRAVFRGEPDTFRAGEANGPLAAVLGERSVLTTDGDPHRRARRLMTPALRGDAVAALEPTMAEVAAAEVATWAEGPIRVHDRMQAVALEIILRTVVGARNPERLAELRRVVPPMLDTSQISSLALLRPGLMRVWPWRRLRRALEAADRVLREEITASRHDPDLADRDDVLARLVRDGDLSDDELRDQLATLLLAGHETTATGLAWALERLVRHPDVLARAVAAADGEGPDDDAYLDAVAAETLRVRPVVSDVVRRLSREATIGDLTLPAGVVVAPAVAAVQCDARRHADPEEFRPERHLGTRVDPATFFPFGGGIRRCVGAAFAMSEMRVVLRAVLRGVELAPTDDPAERPRGRHVTAAPARGARIVVGSRRPTSSRPADQPISVAPK